MVGASDNHDGDGRRLATYDLRLKSRAGHAAMTCLMVFGIGRWHLSHRKFKHFLGSMQTLGMWPDEARRLWQSLLRVYPNMLDGFPKRLFYTSVGDDPGSSVPLQHPRLQPSLMQEVARLEERVIQRGDFSAAAAASRLAALGLPMEDKYMAKRVQHRLDKASSMAINETGAVAAETRPLLSDYLRGFPCVVSPLPVGALARCTTLSTLSTLHHPLLSQVDLSEAVAAFCQWAKLSDIVTMRAAGSLRQLQLVGSLQAGGEQQVVVPFEFVQKLEAWGLGGCAGLPPLLAEYGVPDVQRPGAPIPIVLAAVGRRLVAEVGQPAPSSLFPAFTGIKGNVSHLDLAPVTTRLLLLSAPCVVVQELMCMTPLGQGTSRAARSGLAALQRQQGGTPLEQLLCRGQLVEGEPQHASCLRMTATDRKSVV